MSPIHLRTLLLLPLLLLLGACATSRSYVNIEVPTSGTNVTGTTKVAVIESISDKRVFEENPSDPSTPSLKKGESFKLNEQERLHAIARKRNGYGKAIGDIQLSPPQSVATIVRQLVTDGLQHRGYQVLPEGTDAPPDALRVNVDINSFWAWLTPGFWVVSMESRLGTSLKIDGPEPRTIDVTAPGKKTAPTGREDNWLEAYDRSFEDYLAKQKQAFDAAKL